MATVCAGGAVAQTWRGAADDTGALIRAGVYAPEYSLGFACTAPSPQGRAVGSGDEDEGRRNGPLGMSVSLGAGLVDPYAAGLGMAPVLASATLVVDGVGYRLPPVAWDEISNDWRVELSLADPLFGALAGAGDLVLDAGTGAAWRYPTDGLAAGLQAAATACATGWAQAGYAVPQAPGQTATPAGVGAAQGEALLTQAIDAHLRRGCEGAYTLEPDAIEAHDLDRDGLPDRIVDWRGVTCTEASARIGRQPYCGAAYCSIDVFLSSRPGAPQDGFIGVGYEVTQAANGAPGLRFGGTVGGCERGECDKIFWWDGTRFRE